VENVEIPVRRSVEEEWIGTEEIDEILRQTYYANKKGSDAKKWSGKKKAPYVSSRTYEPVVRKYNPDEKEYLLVDGYNIIFAWKELSELAKVNIDGARGRLLDIMCNYQGMRKCELIVVFDAYRVKGHDTEILDFHNIHVVYTKEAETADAYIERFAHENGRKYRVTVATSDGLEQVIIRGQGCQLISAREFEEEVKRCEKNLRQDFLEKQPIHRNRLGDSLSEEVVQRLKEI
jgi:predicted RNA-binding protein with PIN domain